MAMPMPMPMPIDPTRTKMEREHKLAAPLLCCAFDPSGRFVLAGGRDRALACVELASGRASELAGHESWISAIARAGDDLVLSADYAGRVVAWDCAGDEPKRRWSVDAHAGTIYGLSISSDGRRFVTGDRDGVVRIGRTEDGGREAELPRIDQPVYGVAWHPDSRRVVTADRRPQSPRIKLWDFAAGEELRTIEVPELSGYRRVEDIEWGGIRGLTVAPDGARIVACGRNGYDGPACLMLYDFAAGQLQRKLAAPFKGFCYAAKFHPEGFLMAVGGDVAKGEIRFWNPEQDAPLATVATPGPCTSIDLHPDGRRFAVTQTIGKGSYPDSGMLTIHGFASD